MHLGLCGAPMTAAYEEIKVRVVHRDRHGRIDLIVISNQSQFLRQNLPSVKFQPVQNYLPNRVPRENVELINKNSEIPRKIPNMLLQI